MSSYLVTGGAGFIGSNIVDELLRRGQTVRVLDNFATGREENLQDAGDRIELIRGDVRDIAAVDAAVAGCDFVLHQAALASVPRSIADPVANNEVNAQGTLNVLVAAQKHGVKRVVYASSSSVYGDSEELPKVESMTPNPMSPYAVAKLAAEYYCRVFAELHGMTTVALRYFNVFGPRQDPGSQYSAVIPIFVKALVEGKAPTIHGDGEQSRDFTYIDNVVGANLRACEANVSGGKVYNIACGGRFSLNQLYAALAARVGTDLRPVYGPPRAGDVKHSMAAIDRIQRELGYQVSVSFEDGIERTVRWYQDVGLKALR
ncbi:MAG: SDR family oxidoreductase [Candidatus Krumholzibacteria bacterium]|nr:SDR family oxidoreductase [Candidatus Krumholzibacteria bacterium]MDH4336460.1 SDR family oxidoreductase [Candidatus Krumholzibacteria bacterium]MDH5269052.1 SDR family oxidoreductase [Candidatus Krumholzibacteria bacterium]MDH5627608.1 SDR family oxidoreductase [Candidatus Krumholzibacteria bacterium]